MKPNQAGLLNSLYLRPSALEDADAISTIYLASRKTFLPYAPLAHSDEAVQGWVREYLLPGGGVTTAWFGETLVGFMALSREGAVGWIDQLYLHPLYTGQGAGTALVLQAKAVLGAPIRLYTFQQNMDARRFYERHGFTAIAFGDGSQNEENCPDVLYEWGGG